MLTSHVFMTFSKKSHIFPRYVAFALVHTHIYVKPVIIGGVHNQLPTAAGRSAYSADLRTGIAGINNC